MVRALVQRIDLWVHGLGGLWLALAVTFVLALPGFFTLPPVDRDEVLFAQSSRQMLETGNFVDIHFGDQVRYKKPVGIYWMQAATAWISGGQEDIWGYRLTSLLGALTAVGFAYGIARRVASPAGAVAVAVAVGASVILGAEARLAKTDAVLLASVTAAQFVLARLWLPAGAATRVTLPFGWAMGFWLALAVQVLVKGPIGPIIPLSTLVGLSLIRRDLALVRALRPAEGLALFAVLVLPWFIAITLKSGGAFWTASVGRDMLAKVGEGQEQHGLPPGFYLATLWLTFWPGAVVLAAMLPAIWRARREAVVVFAALWVIPFWLIFEVTATKLLHYTLPTYPALALVAIWAWQAVGPGQAWLARLAALVPFAALAGLGLGLRRIGVEPGLAFWLGAVLILPASLLVLLAERQRRAGALAMGFALSGLAFALAVYPTLAGSSMLWPAARIQAIAAERPGCPLIVAGYNEPSVVFWSDNHARQVDGATAAAAFVIGTCATAVVGDRALANFSAALPDVAPAASFRGLNIGGGRLTQFSVFIR